MTFPVPHQEDGTTIGETHWNGLVDAINADHTTITDASTGNAALGSRVTTVETRTTDASTGNAALGTRMTAVESGKVPTTRTISAGTGLSGGGDLSANRSLAVSFGTAAGTAAQGNDSRITVTQDGTIGNSALGSRVSTLEGKVTAASAQPSQAASAVNRSFRTQSTGYTSSPQFSDDGANWTTPSTASLPGVTFTTPPSGRVLVLVEGEVWSAGLGLAKLAVAIKVSSTNAGDVVGASDLYALAKYNTDSIQAGKSRLIVSGLTPGTSYYAQVQLASRESTVYAMAKNPSVTVLPQM